MGELGTRMHELSFSANGTLSNDRWDAFMAKLVSAIGMTVAGKPARWEYPFNGKGGVGITTVQPLTESAILIDTWPEHGGAYIRISSCKEFDHACAFEVIEDFGLEILDVSYAELGLKPKRDS